jgi:hydrogenase maturation factor HypE
VKKSKFGDFRQFNGQIYQFLTRLEKKDEEKIEEIKQQFREKGYTNLRRVLSGKLPTQKPTVRIGTSTIVNSEHKALYGNGRFNIE